MKYAMGVWSEKETAKLRALWPNHSCEEMSKILKRKIPSIQGRAYWLGLPSKALKVGHVFTDDECAFIDELTPTGKASNFLIDIRKALNSKFGINLTHGEFLNARRRALGNGRIRDRNAVNGTLRGLRAWQVNDSLIDFDAAAKRFRGAKVALGEGYCDESGCTNKTAGRYCDKHVSRIINNPQAYKIGAGK